VSVVCSERGRVVFGPHSGNPVNPKYAEFSLVRERTLDDRHHL
jgi:hypothetical protein